MPSEHAVSLPEKTKGFFGNFFKKKPVDLKNETSSKPTPETVVEELEQSLTKEDVLAESNLLTGDKEDERKNNKNRVREETLDAQNEDDKENTNAAAGHDDDDDSGVKTLWKASKRLLNDQSNSNISSITSLKKKDEDETKQAEENDQKLTPPPTVLGKMEKFFGLNRDKKPVPTQTGIAEEPTGIRRFLRFFGIGKRARQLQSEVKEEVKESSSAEMQAKSGGSSKTVVKTSQQSIPGKQKSGSVKTATSSQRVLAKVSEDLSKDKQNLETVKSSQQAFEKKIVEEQKAPARRPGFIRRLLNVFGFGRVQKHSMTLKGSEPKDAVTEEDVVKTSQQSVPDKQKSGSVKTATSSQRVLAKVSEDLSKDKQNLETVKSSQQAVKESSEAMLSEQDDIRATKEVSIQTFEKRVEEEVPKVPLRRRSFITKLLNVFGFRGFQKHPRTLLESVSKQGVIKEDEEEEKEEKELPETSETRIEDGDQPVAKPRSVHEAIHDDESGQPKSIGPEEGGAPRRSTRLRRKRKKASKIQAPPVDGEEVHETSADQVADAMQAVNELNNSVIPPDEDLLSITVHRSDHLRANLKDMSHPTVKVSLVDGLTGNYLPKSSNSRKVTSYYEPENVTCVLPVMTQPFDFRRNQSVLPRWEETILFNESYESMIRKRNIQITSAVGDQVVEEAPVDSGLPAPSPIIFFVIRDFVSMQKANNQRKGVDDVDKGWHTIAWAFLKLVGSDGKPNSGKKLRLQLFQPPRNATVTSQASDQSEPAFTWWNSYPRVKYPSTLYVTVKAVKAPSNADGASPGLFALQPEGNSTAYELLHKSLQFGDQSQHLTSATDQTPKWTRLPGQTCKLPNAVSLKLWSASDGAFTVQFSNAGLKLAIACKHGTGYPVLLYGIPGGEEMGALIGHQQLVYDIHWSNDDRRLVTSSGDGTAQVWDLNDKTKPTHTLPHPAYVYTGAFHPSSQYIVATGGYDAVIRVWNIVSEQAQILQELEGHKSLINSIAFDYSHLTLYSADGAGVVIAWTCLAYEKPDKNMKIEWKLKTKFADKDLTDVCINNIRIHHNNKKLLLHCRDSIMRMFDVRINTSVNLTGSLNRRQFLRSALTPCGTFVMSGSEDGHVYVWNADTGDQVAIYNELGFSRPVRDVSFHPHEHMVAICSFSPGMPVLVYRYDKDANMIGGGLSIVSESLIQKLDEQPSDFGLEALPPRPASKISRIKRQLDSVLPEGSDDERSPWFVAKKALPVSMALRAFNDLTRAQVPSPILDDSEHGGIPADQLISPRRTPSHRHSHIQPASSYNQRLSPSYFSPHASQESQRIAREYSSHQSKLEEDNRLWKPSFSSVGGSPYRNDSFLSPDVTLTIDRTGNRSLRISASPELKRNKQEYVVVIYDYQANRSDELTMVRGDIIKVLYKDGPSWWFGEKRSDMTQGYFPTSYVSAQDEDEIPEEKPEVPFTVPTKRPDTAESEDPKTVHALKMHGGKVRFYSQSESEGDDEVKKAALSLSSRQRRREKRSQLSTTPEPSSTSAPVSVSSMPSQKLPLSSENVKEETPTDPVPVVESTPKPRKRQRPSRIMRQPEPPIEYEEDASAIVGSQIIETPPSVNSDQVLEVERPRFGVLKEIQARMEAEDPSFSESVIRGSEFSPRPIPLRRSMLDPVVTSRPSKARPSHPKRRSKKSQMRSHEKLEHDETISMVRLTSNTPPSEGRQNPAYDAVSDL